MVFWNFLGIYLLKRCHAGPGQKTRQRHVGSSSAASRLVGAGRRAAGGLTAGGYAQEKLAAVEGKWSVHHGEGRGRVRKEWFSPEVGRRREAAEP